MFDSESVLAMDRIILEFLLIFALGGLVLQSSGEGQNVSAIAEKNLNSSEENHLKDIVMLSTSESITLNTDENTVDKTSNHTETAQSSSMPSSNSEAFKESESMYSSETAKLELTSSIPSTGSNIINSSDNSSFSSSDIDYGGYNSGVDNNSSDRELADNKDIQKAGLEKLNNEFITLEAETVSEENNIEEDSVPNSEVAKGNSKLDSSSFTISTSNMIPLESLSTSSASSISKDEKVPNFSASILNTLDGNTNIVPETVSPDTSISTQKKVSASPKSATKKRSLNSTNDVSVNVAHTSPTISNFETSSSSKLVSFHTATMSKLDLEIEELPTPLPLENQNNKSNEQVFASHPFSTEISASMEKIEDNSNMLSANQSSTSLTDSFNTDSTVNTADSKSSVEILNSQPISSAAPLREIETKTQSFDGFTIVNGTRIPLVSFSDILSHESDDIIYAGFAEEEPIGVTFDPDGMTNDLPQDPDSIIFSVPPKPSNKVSTERYTDSHKNHPEKESIELWNTEFLPHDGPESEVADINSNNSSEIFDQNAVLKSNFSESLVQPQVINSKPASSSDDSAEMMQDAPHINNDGIDHGSSYQHPVTTPTSDSKLPEVHDFGNEKRGSTLIATEKSNTDSYLALDVIETSKVESSSDYIIHRTDQSVIRPVKVIYPSTESSESGVSLPQPLEVSTLPSPSVELSVNTSQVEAAKIYPDISSPIKLSTAEPNVTNKLPETLDISSVSTQPELAVSVYSKNGTLNNTDEISELSSYTNSSISGIGIKTSVSVSLPLSNHRNASQETQILNGSEPVLPANGVNFSSISLNNTDSSASSPLETSPDVTTIIPSTTTIFKILKPIIKIPGGTDASSVRTRKPFTPSYRRPSTTAGPPVSIFKKSRTRINSITSSTTSKPFRQFSTVRIHYSSHLPGIIPGGEMFVSVEPITTTVPPPTTTEEPISEVPFTDQTFTPSLSSEDDVTLIKVGGGIVLDKGLRWTDQLANRHSPEFKEKAKQMHLHLEQLFRSSPIAPRLWRIEIDGFNGTKNYRSVEVDFILYLIKSHEKVVLEHLTTVFHQKLSPNNTFARYRVDPSRTSFEMLQEEPLNKPTPSPENEEEPPVPQWAIAVIVICAASLIFIVLFAAVTMYGRHHMRRRYGNKLSEDELDRSSGDWESKMTAAYENMAADTIYDAEDLRGDTYKKSYIMD